MQNWVNYFSCLFLLSLVLFSSNLNNLIKLIFYSELVWVILYCYSTLYGSLNDDLNIISTSIFILGFAGLEYSIGILILIIFKNLNETLDLQQFDKKKNNFILFNTNNIYLNRYIWK